MRISRPFPHVLALLALAATPAAAVERPATPADAPGAVPGRVIVEWEPGAARAERRAARAGASAPLVRTLGAARFQLLRVEPGQTVVEALRALRRDPAVRLATRDRYALPHGVPDDPLLDQLWGLRNLGAGVAGFPGPLAGADVGAVAAWDRAVGRPGVVIADLDTGYRFDHPDLAGVAWRNPAELPGNGVDDDGNGYVDDVHGWDFVGPDSDVAYAGDADPTDDDLLAGGHGVHTAGTMAAAGNDGTGITGVARNVRVMPLRVCSLSESVHASACPDSAQIAAINYAGANGARVANLSLGGPDPDPAVLDALAHNPQTLFVISAGNDAQDDDVDPTYPCVYDPASDPSPPVPGAIDNVVCVAATDQADGLAGFSSYGASTVDLGAPGTETLSAYFMETFFAEDFEAGDFVATWAATGADGGFARTSEAPLASSGMSDSPGAAPAPLSVRESTATLTLPPGFGSCTLSQSRALSNGTGTYTYRVLLNGATLLSASPSSSGDVLANVTSPELLAGGTLQLRFRYAAGAVTTSGNGVWLDDIALECAQAPGHTSLYAFLDGTSMAAPHVSGAAALLFSLKPSASVTEVRDALLATADPDPALAGRTASGGRLDVAAALDALVPPGQETQPPETALLAAPPASTASAHATFAFRRADADAATFACRLDAAAWAPCGSPASYEIAPGAHSFAVRAQDAFGHVDPTPASFAWTVSPPSVTPAPAVAAARSRHCVVPRLKGRTVRRARRALRRAHCRAGALVRPRRMPRRGPSLVVRASRPRAGAVRVAGTHVRLVLRVRRTRR